MEGRKPPPRASHPFPNNPDLSKFWNTPLSKAFFKSFGAFFLAFSVWGGINFYITRHEKGPFGMDITYTKEQAETRKKVLKESSILNSDYGLPMEFKHKKQQFSPELRFDDGVNFVAPTDRTKIQT